MEQKNDWLENKPEEYKKLHEKYFEADTEYWRGEIKKAGLTNELRFFNDVISGKEAPKGYGEPVLRDVDLDGFKCDIYHSDHEKSDTYHRIFIHIKNL